MRKLRQRNRFAGNLTAEDIIAIEELEAQLSEELDDVEVDDVDVVDDGKVDDVKLDDVKVDDVKVDDVKVDDVEVETETETETEQLIKEAQEIMEACEGQDEAAEVLKACNELEQQINASSDVVAPDDKEIISEEQEVLNACAELEAKIASEFAPGIEDEIGDEAKGGDPSVSTITDSKVDVSTDKEVFPTNSEYVAKITARLDRVANILEKRGMKRMAFRVDQLSDKLEASIRK